MNKISMLSMISWFLLIFMLIFLIKSNLHPIPMMIILIFYSILINLNLSTWKHNYMFSIFLFLMMISGLLIIFLYFASLISNAQNKFIPYKILFFLFMMNFFYFFFLMFSYNSHLSLHHPNNFLESNPLNFINQPIFQNIKIIYNYPFNIITLICLFYLLLILFSIIKMCTIKTITLRKIIN